MNLARPIIFIDLEATGADATRDRIVEIALIKLFPDRRTEEYVRRINPGVRIPSEVIAVHGITNEAVANAPRFKDIAEELLAFFEGCDVGGFGITRFDIPMLVEEFRRSQHELRMDGRHVIDGLVIYHQKERRDLAAAYQFYCQKELKGAHGARADALASMEVLFAQCERYTDLPRELSDLHDLCNRPDQRFVDAHRKFVWKDGEAAFNFGKYKGELLRHLAENQPDYIQWIVSEGKFAQDVVDICWKALRGEFPSNKKSVAAAPSVTQPS